MRKQLAGTLALVVALASLPFANRAYSSLTQSRADAAPAPFGAHVTVGASTIKKGSVIAKLVSPPIDVPVPGYADVFLAGRTFPFTISGPHGVDVAQRNGPAQVKIAVAAGRPISVVAKFATANGFSAPTAPDANGFTRSVIQAGPAEHGIRPLGISSVRAPMDALVGLFTGPHPGSGKTPPALDFSTARARDAATVKPRLNQVFFIGTGLTAKGGSKQFIIPAGATSLYLGSLDYAGGNHDNHGTILAQVTGARLVTIRVAPTPTAPAATRVPPRRPTATSVPRPRVTGTPTTIPVIGMILPTDTPSGTPTITPTPVPPGGFQYNAQGQLVNAQGTPVALNEQSTPINNLGTPVNAQGMPVNAVGTPVNEQGTPVNQQGTPLPTETPGPGTPTSVPPTDTPVPSASVTPTGTPAPPPPPTPITQAVTELWPQYQFDYRHNGYQEQDTADAQASLRLDLDPNADPLSPFYAGNLHLQTSSPPINGNVSVAGGPVLGLNGLYYTSGQDAALRCDWANGTPSSGFACPAGFTRISFGSNFEDDVPVINPAGPSENIVYYLSHNNPTGQKIDGQTGSLTAYNANTGGPVASYPGSVVLPTAPGVALTVNGGDTICYVPTSDGMLHYLSCGPNGTDGVLPGRELPGSPVALGGTPLAGVAIDAADNLVLVAVQKGGGALGSTTFGQGTTGVLQAFSATTPGAATWSMPLPGNGAVYTPFQPIVAGSEAVVATNYGVAAYSLPSGTQLWARTGTVTGAGLGGGGTCSTSTGDLVPGGYSVSFNAEDAPAYDPFPTGADAPSIYVGLPLNGGIQFGNVLARLNAATGAICALGTTAQSGGGIPISGAPVTTTGAPTTSTTNPLTVARDVVFYADNAGLVYALDASTLAPLINSANHAFPDQARPGIPGVVPPPPAGTNTPYSPPIGASLIIANGHLYFGNSAGTLFNYSY